MKFNKAKIKKAPALCFHFLCSHLFLLFALEFFLAFLAVFFLFWAYYSDRQVTEQRSDLIELNRDLLGNFSQSYEQEREQFDQALFQDYADPFKGF